MNSTQPPLQDFWQALEAIPALSAVPKTWRAWLGDYFEPFKNTFLESKSYTVNFYPCPIHCLCAHVVCPLPDGSFVAKCECDPPECPDILLTRLEVIPLFLDLKHLARVLCPTYGLHPTPLDFDLDRTSQIGSWSADAVPVFLTVQFDRNAFHRVVAQLIGRLHQPLIILAPTAGHLDGVTREIMSNFGAAFFSLESTTILDPDGTLRLRTIPGELFAQFNPQPTEPIGDNAAHQVYQFVKAMDSEPSVRLAPPSKVFLLFFEGLTIKEIARKCKCSTRLVLLRRKWLCEKLGRDIAEFRPYSAQFENIEQSLSDPQAREIYRKGEA
jgi:hypothetical protein